MQETEIYQQVRARARRTLTFRLDRARLAAIRREREGRRTRHRRAFPMLSPMERGAAGRAPTIGATVTDCGHICCQARANPCHVHICAPEGCDGCAKAAEHDQEGARDRDVAAITAAVMRSMVPHVAGLPGGRDLDRLVADRVQELHREALADHELIGLAVAEWRNVVVVRVGLALAFPHEWPATGESYGR